MKLLAIADKEIREELKEKFDRLGELNFYDESMGTDFGSFDWILDFILHENQDHISRYKDFSGVLFISGQFISTIQLKRDFSILKDVRIIGMNSLPTFINRDLLELSVTESTISGGIEKVLESMNVDYEIVEDRVGLVTPRVICMIINEAYYTVQEGTASKDAIDTAMKLGTNYPLGPFEWCNRIGIKNVYQVLQHVYEDTNDPRYIICPLLKKEYTIQA